MVAALAALLAPLLLGALVAPPAQAGTVSGRLADGHVLVWAGIDYRAVQIYVPESFADPAEKVAWGPGGGLFDFVGTFADEQEAWIRLCLDWNQMYLNERVPQVAKQLGMRVVTDVPGTCQEAYGDPPRFQPEGEAARHPPTMNETAVVAAVGSWPVTQPEGVALLVIAERFAKAEDRACVWPTFFDIESRKVLATERVCAAPGGLGFRNYWFGPVAFAVKGVVAKVASGKM